MLKKLKFYQSVRFDNKSMAILWVESVVFAVIYGLMFKLWLVGGIIFLILVMLIGRPMTAVYAIFVLSFLWSFVFTAIGYGIGGLVGGMVLGAMVFLNGVRLHFRDLRFSCDTVDPSEYVNTIEWRRSWYDGRPNLN
jgi:uncharacterized membrane protein